MDLFLHTITHPAFGVVTALIGFLLGNHFALGRDRRKEFIAAAVKFRSIVAKEMSEFTNRDTTCSYPPLHHLEILYAGLLEFKPVLPPRKQKTITQLWQQYKKHEELRDRMSWPEETQQTTDYLNQFLSYAE